MVAKPSKPCGFCAKVRRQVSKALLKLKRQKQ